MKRKEKHMIETESQVKILDLNQTDQIIEELKDKLRNGDKKGSGKFRFGIQGDIENIMGWHSQHSPQTPLTEDLRVQRLNSLKEAVAQSPNISEMSDIVNWLDERINEVIIRQVDPVIENANQIPETQKGEAQIILEEIANMKNSLQNIEVYKDSHPLASQRGVNYSEEQLQEISKLLKEIDKKKVELYNLLKA